MTGDFTFESLPGFLNKMDGSPFTYFCEENQGFNVVMQSYISCVNDRDFDNVQDEVKSFLGETLLLVSMKYSIDSVSSMLESRKHLFVNDYQSEDVVEDAIQEMQSILADMLKDNSYSFKKILNLASMVNSISY